MQEVLRESPQLLRRGDQPLQHRVRGDLEHARRASDAQALGEACDDAYDELDGGALAMEEGAEGLEKIAATNDAQQLSPGTAIGMAIGAEIAPSDPAAIRTVWVGAKVRRSV